MAASPDYSHFIKTDVEGRSRLDLAIDGITCAACLDDIETAMKRLPGVMLARLNLTSHRLAVTCSQSASKTASDCIERQPAAWQT